MEKYARQPVQNRRSCIDLSKLPSLAVKIHVPSGVDPPLALSLPEKGKQALLLKSKQGLLVASLNAQDSVIISGLLKCPALELQCDLLFDDTLNDTVSQKRTVKGRRLPSASSVLLTLTVYGNLGIIDIVGEYLLQCGSFLQPPRHARAGVKYMNPQNLPVELEDAPFASEIFNVPEDIGTLDNDAKIDPSAGLEACVSLLETPTPRSLRCELHP